jgi:hypothetical protein
MNKTGCLLLFTLLANGLFAQSRDTTWKDLIPVETAFYQLQVPSNWLELGSLGDVVAKSYDATSVYFPDSFNTAPILVGLFILNQPGFNLEEVKQSCLHGYRNNPDRIFPKDFMEGQQKIKLSSGQDAYILNTRFYRETKKLNQSRFDLVVFSDKAMQGYLVTVSIQYKDPTYAFEQDFHLEGFARKLFSYFGLK